LYPFIVGKSEIISNGLNVSIIRVLLVF